MRLRARSPRDDLKFEMWGDRHPVAAFLLGGLVVIGGGAFVVGELARHADLLGGRFGARVKVGIVWMLVWGALWLAAQTVWRRSPRRGEGPSVGRIIGGSLHAAAALMLFAIWWAALLPYRHESWHVAPEDAVPRLTFVLGNLLALGGFLGVALSRRRRDQRRSSAEGPVPAQASPSVDHEAVVLDVRPSEGDGFDPYLVGTCSCGWIGPIREDVRLAIADVVSHRPGGEPEIIRPLA